MNRSGIRARDILSITTAFLITFLIGACGGTSAIGGGDAAQAGTSSTAELEAIYRARLDSARQQFTSADVHFMTGMIPHHAQALVMARFAPTHGASEQVRTLASRIINAQKDEIATMQRWLRDRGQPVPKVHTDDSAAMTHDHHAMHMPGMLTPEQLEELDAARDATFDRLFLTYMIQHHRGAVSMVNDLFASDGAAQDEAVFKLASDIHVDQITEVARMERMLSDLPKNGQDP